MTGLKVNSVRTIVFLTAFLVVAFVFNEADGKRARPPSFCWLDWDAGPCRAVFQAWYYNKKASRCEEFIYGGCGGNKNNFKSLEECEMKCHKIMAWGV